MINHDNGAGKGGGEGGGHSGSTLFMEAHIGL